MSASNDSVAKSLAQSVRQLINAGAFGEVISAIELGLLTTQSGSVSIAKLAAGRTGVQSALTHLTWSIVL